MININKNYSVKNRSASIVVYNIPELGIRREFAPRETKRISFDELEKLSFQQGGREIMANFLQIDAEEATNELGIKREPEYDMSEEQIIELIQKGSLEAFLDALDFAPIGVIDLIKKFAVELPMNDVEKRNALFEKTGFDVTKAVSSLIPEENTKSEEKTVEVKKALEGRRTTAQYKVVTPKA